MMTPRCPSPLRFTALAICLAVCHSAVQADLMKDSPVKFPDFTRGNWKV